MEPWGLLRAKILLSREYRKAYGVKKTKSRARKVRG